MLVHGIVPPQAQGFALLLVNPLEVPAGPFLQPVEVFLTNATVFVLWKRAPFCIQGVVVVV